MANGWPLGHVTPGSRPYPDAPHPAGQAPLPLCRSRSQSGVTRAGCSSRRRKAASSPA
jgi:hypothetical protein